MKHPFIVDRQHTALVVVDMQEKFRPALDQFDAVTQNVVKLILGFQMYQMPILVTEQYPKGLGATVEIIRRQFKGFDPIEKTEFACTDNAVFEKRLEALNVKSVVLCGIETHVCINQTALGLLQRDYRVHIVTDASASRSPNDHDIAMKKMLSAGVLPATTEMCLFELAEKAGTESFKHIQRMVKARHTLSTDEPPAEKVSAPSPSAAGEEAELPKKENKDTSLPETKPDSQVIKQAEDRPKPEPVIAPAEVPQEKGSKGESEEESGHPTVPPKEEEIDLEGIVAESKDTAQEDQESEEAGELSEEELAEIESITGESDEVEELTPPPEEQGNMETKAIRREPENAEEKEQEKESTEDEVLDMEDILRMGNEDDESKK